MKTEFFIPDTAGLEVTVDGVAYTLAGNIEYAFDEDAVRREPYCTVITPVAQTFHPSHPGEIGEINWKPMFLEDLDAWIDSGNFNSRIDGIIWAGDD